jgi:flagellar biosynthesis activator protein FlaF
MSAAYLEAYKKSQTDSMSGREIEAAALTRCAQLLSDCQKNWDTPNHDLNLSEALRINQRVWSILQGELTSPDNPLPKRLKEDLLSLSIFIDKRIIQVLAHPESAKLNILIDINLNIAAGLNSNPDNGKEKKGSVVPLPVNRPTLTNIRA